MRSRAYRRHQLNRIKALILRQERRKLQDSTVTDELVQQWARKRTSTRTPCSCWMCCNSTEPTVQERSLEQLLRTEQDD